jgi:hypothetical protein
MVRHRRSDVFVGLIGAALGVGILTGHAPTAIAQAQVAAGNQDCRPAKSVAPAEALQMAAKLKMYFSSASFQGRNEIIKDASGIIIGDKGGNLYLATALHAMFNGTTPVDSVHAFFYSSCNTPVPARLCSADTTASRLDLAILCVPAAARSNVRPPSLSRRGNSRQIGIRTPVYPVGCPGGECWGVGQPDRVLLVNLNLHRILFTTFFVAPGHSGGPLFNEWWEVVGMVTQVGQPLSEALPIDSILGVACGTSCGRQEHWLHPPFVPRGGYRYSLGVAGLFSTSDASPGGRFPGGRATLMYRLTPLVELHAGIVRLTPQDLSVTSGMAGLGLTLKATERVLVNPFLEGGFGHVEGRFSDSGYLVDDNGTNRFVPFYQQVKDDGLGFGAGVAVQALVVPRTIIELTVGHWNFNRPDSARALPDVFVGAGLRLGI